MISSAIMNPEGHLISGSSPSTRPAQRLDQDGSQAIARIGCDPLVLGPLEKLEDPCAEVLLVEVRHPRHDMDMQMFETRLLAEQYDVRFHAPGDCSQRRRRALEDLPQFRRFLSGQISEFLHVPL
jgi:hypothetical protein